MISNIYQNFILNRPKIVLFLLIIIALVFGYKSKDFRLDASSETLLIEGDPDLKYLQEINEKFGAKEFLVLTLTPKDKITSEIAINNILSLKYKIQSLDWVHNTVTILDIPLLDSSDEPLMDRIKNFRTLKDDNVDKERGFKEILNSPVFRNFVISEDSKTTGIIVNIKQKEKPQLGAFKNKQEIEKYKDDLIVLSGSSYGEIPSKILKYGEKDAEESLEWWHEKFKDDFYLEVMRHGEEQEEIINSFLIKFSKKYKINFKKKKKMML